jgi:hypothetical protein
MAYYSAIMKNEIMSFAGKWVEQDHNIKQKKPDSKR